MADGLVLRSKSLGGADCPPQSDTGNACLQMLVKLLNTDISSLLKVVLKFLQFAAKHPDIIPLQ